MYRGDCAGETKHGGDDDDDGLGDDDDEEDDDEEDGETLRRMDSEHLMVMAGGDMQSALAQHKGFTLVAGEAIVFTTTAQVVDPVHAQHGRFMVSTLFVYFEPDDAAEDMGGGFVDAAASTSDANRRRSRSMASHHSSGSGGSNATMAMKAESGIPRRWPLAALRSVLVSCAPAGCGLGCVGDGYGG